MEKIGVSVLLMVIKDVTIITTLTHQRNSFFKCKQHTIHDSRGSENPL